MVTTTHTNGSVIDLRSNAGSPTFLGAINFNNTAGTTPGQIAYTGANTMTFKINGSERLRINSIGDVGIGTLTPSHKLEVIGSKAGGAVGHFVNFLLTQDNGYGVYGACNIVNERGYGGYFEGGKFGASGRVTPSASGTFYGLHGKVEPESFNGGSNIGVLGEGRQGGENYGILGSASGGLYNYGVKGIAAGGNETTSYGIYGMNEGSGTRYAGYFEGNVNVTGILSKGGGSFKIDHPLDAENKYLNHSFVESPDMMNIYNGNLVTNENGDAIVGLPDYFEPLNRDFRYQLTVIGQFAQAIISEEITNNQFSVKTDKPNVKVSWQVTGIRQDAYANSHRIQVEEDKPAHERGKYLHPEVFGKPREMSVNYHPEHEAERKRMEEEHKLQDESHLEKVLLNAKERD
jgi:hypothetical protein